MVGAVHYLAPRGGHLRRRRRRRVLHGWGPRAWLATLASTEVAAVVPFYGVIPWEAAQPDYSVPTRCAGSLRRGRRLRRPARGRRASKPPSPNTARRTSSSCTTVPSIGALRTTTGPRSSAGRGPPRLGAHLEFLREHVKAPAREVAPGRAQAPNEPVPCG
jgi:hypothetical protein